VAVFDELGEEREVRVGAGPIRYRERGRGEPVVFLHGVLMNADVWHRVVPIVADAGHRCIAPDLPTGGHTVALDRGARVTPAALGELARELLDALGLERATVVGNGLGTVLAEMLCVEHPERVERVVFAAGDIASTFPPRWARTRFAVAFAPPIASAVVRASLATPRGRVASYRRFTHRVDERVVRSFAAGFLADRGVRRDTLKLMRAICVGRTGTEHGRLRELRRPALVVWGEDDIAFPRSHVRELTDLLPDVRVELVPGSRTFLALDQPRAFADALLRFLRG
jgi:pimeloyl-ACP methyl ester carboxylesterase